MPRVQMTDELHTIVKEINLRSNIEKDKFFKKGARIHQTDYLYVGRVIDPLNPKNKRKKTRE